MIPGSSGKGRTCCDNFYQGGTSVESRNVAVEGTCLGNVGLSGEPGSGENGETIEKWSSTGREKSDIEYLWLAC